MFDCLMALTLILLRQGVNCTNTTNVSSTTEKMLQPITLAIILPSTKPYIFRRQLVQPAIEYAVASVAKEMANLGYRYQVAYRDSFCDEHGASLSARAFRRERYVVSKNDSSIIYKRGIKNGKSGTLFKRKRRDLPHPARSRLNSHALRFSRTKVTPLVFLGPGCNGAAEEVSLLAEIWNIPMITSGAPTLKIDPDKLTTLTRIGASHYDFAQFIWRIFTERGYGKEYPIHLLYEAGWESGTAEDECMSIIQTLATSLPAFDRRFHLYAPKFIVGDINGDHLVQELMDPRVVLMCASSEKVRQIMIGAYRAGYANRDTSHWFAVDMHNRSHYTKEPWKKGDGQDSIAKEAFKALMIITVYAGRGGRFKQFRQTMLRNYQRNGIHEDVNEFVIGFHDAVILHKRAFATSILQDEDVTDGAAITRNMREVMIQGIAGPVVMGKHGNKRGDYSILAMTDYKAGTFSSVFDYLGTFGLLSGELPVLNATKIAQHRNDTVCSKQSEWQQRKLNIRKELDAIADATESQDILIGILGTLGGLTLCCLLVFVPVCHQKRRRAKPHMSENGTVQGDSFGNPERACLHRPLRQETSVATCMTTIDSDEPT